MQKNKINVYIDGFNLYYGLLAKRPQSKGLNPVAFVKRILKEGTPIPYSAASIIQIKYFTARIKSLSLPLCSRDKKKETKDKNRQQAKIARQRYYLKLLRDQQDIEIIEGYYQVPVTTKELPEIKKENGKLCFTGKFFTTRTISEKGSDANLVVHLLRDSYDESCYGEWGIVISNDADLCSAIEAVQGDICKKSILLINPHAMRRSPNRLERTAKSFTRLHDLKDLNILLEDSQFPDAVTLSDGHKIQNPWGKFSPKKLNILNRKGIDKGSE